MTINTQSRTALKELISVLQEVDERWCSEEWNLASEADIAGAHRALMHTLETGLVGSFEMDPVAPDFRRIVTTSRKLTGDNADAIYFDAPVSADYVYEVTGNIGEAVYFSITIEEGAEDGSIPSNTSFVLNDKEIEFDDEGNFKIQVGGEKPAAGSYMPLTPGASRITTRSYYESEESAACDPLREPRFSIRCLNPDRVPDFDSDTAVATNIRRVAQFVHSRTLGLPPMVNAEQPPFVSLTPNVFPAPIPPGNFGLSAFDAHYSMAPYFLAEDEALVITGRWPECRFGNVNLWNRFQQTYDFKNRTTALNRAQTELEADGSFKMIISHRDPGHANWLDTENKPFGMVFWRFFLAEGEVETPQAEVVKFADL